MAQEGGVPSSPLFPPQPDPHLPTGRLRHGGHRAPPPGADGKSPRMRGDLSAHSSQATQGLCLGSRTRPVLLLGLTLTFVLKPRAGLDWFPHGPHGARGPRKCRQGLRDEEVGNEAKKRPRGPHVCDQKQHLSGCCVGLGQTSSGTRVSLSRKAGALKAEGLAALPRGTSSGSPSGPRASLPPRGRHGP